MIKHNLLALGAALFMCLTMLYSCSSDIESADEALNSMRSSSSNAVGLSSSSSIPKIFCQVQIEGITICNEYPEEVCSVLGGNSVESCEVSSSSSDDDGTSSSSGDEGGESSSSSSLNYVLCKITIETGTYCESIPDIACNESIGGEIVESCEIPSSSSNGNSSDSVGSSSSDAVPSSSSYENTEPGKFEGSDFIDPRDGKRYRTEVALDGKIWFSENLNYSRGNTLGWCYDGDVLSATGADLAGCERPYGRAYSWEIARDGNGSRGLCPIGWHIPSRDEWNGISGPLKMSEGFYVLAGNYNFNEDWPPLGWKDKYQSGYYWANSGNFAFMQSDNVSITNDDFPIEYMFVRCVMDGTFEPKCGGRSYDPATQFCFDGETYPRCNREYDPNTEKCEGGYVISKSESSNYCSSYPTGSYCDRRDGKIYTEITIVSQTWMKENLDFNYGETLGDCYEHNSANCEIYGRLYNWAEAIKVCPEGWRLPDSDEWETLVNVPSDIAGMRLRAERLWEFKNCDHCEEDNHNRSTDDFGFSALPAGMYDGNSFDLITRDGYWWTSTENWGNTAADVWYTHHWNPDMEKVTRNKGYKLSVRCIKNSNSPVMKNSKSSTIRKRKR